MSDIAKIIFTNKEVIPEPLQEKAVRTEAGTFEVEVPDAGYVLKTEDQLSALNKRMEDETKKAKDLSSSVRDLKEKVDAFGEVTPDKVVSMQKQIEAFGDADSVEKRAEAMFREQASKLTKEHESQLGEMANNAKSHQEEAQKFRRLFEDSTLSNIGMQAFQKDGNEQIDTDVSMMVLGPKLELAKGDDGEFKLDAFGRPQVVVRDGDSIALNPTDGSPMSVEDFISKRFKREKPHLFKGNPAVGGGAHGGGGGVDLKGENPWKTGNLRAQAEVFKSDPQQAKRLASEAGKPLAR